MNAKIYKFNEQPSLDLGLFGYRSAPSISDITESKHTIELYHNALSMASYDAVTAPPGTKSFVEAPMNGGKTRAGAIAARDAILNKKIDNVIIEVPNTSLTDNVDYTTIFGGVKNIEIIKLSGSNKISNFDFSQLKSSKKYVFIVTVAKSSYTVIENFTLPMVNYIVNNHRQSVIIRDEAHWGTIFDLDGLRDNLGYHTKNYKGKNAKNTEYLLDNATNYLRLVSYTATPHKENTGESDSKSKYKTRNMRLPFNPDKLSLAFALRKSKCAAGLIIYDDLEEEHHYLSAALQICRIAELYNKKRTFLTILPREEYEGCTLNLEANLMIQARAFAKAAAINKLPRNTKFAIAVSLQQGNEVYTYATTANSYRLCKKETDLDFNTIIDRLNDPDNELVSLIGKRKTDTGINIRNISSLFDCTNGASTFDSYRNVISYRKVQALGRPARPEEGECVLDIVEEYGHMGREYLETALFNLCSFTVYARNDNKNNLHIKDAYMKFCTKHSCHMPDIISTVLDYAYNKVEFNGTVSLSNKEKLSQFVLELGETINFK